MNLYYIHVLDPQYIAATKGVNHSKKVPIPIKRATEVDSGSETEPESEVDPIVEEVSTSISRNYTRFLKV